MPCRLRVLEHPAQLDRQLRKRLAPPRHVVAPLQRIRDGAHDALEKVPPRDALQGVDDGVA